MSILPSYIVRKTNQIMQTSFIATFVLLFIFIYHPLDLGELNIALLQNWGWPDWLISSTITAAVILIGLGVCTVSRVMMTAYTRKHSITIFHYALWIAAEIIVMAAIYTLGSYFNDSSRTLSELFRVSLYKTILVLFIPYFISYGIMIWKEQASRLKAMSSELEEHDKPSEPYIRILDEKGEMRLSIKRDSLLYIEAEDNYICVSYLAGKNVKNMMVRTTLKRVAEQLDSERIVRCHRSYLVNTDHIKVLRKEKDGFYIEMGIDNVPDIPISKTYGESIIKLMMKY